jgi:hypothetical protein
MKIPSIDAPARIGLCSTPAPNRGLLQPQPMSDESPSSPENPANPSTEGAPRVRRISNPRPKKQPKPAPKPEAAAEVAAPVRMETPKPGGFPEFPSTSEAAEDAPPRNDWPEPEPASSGVASSPENPKRKRRRKKGKGGGQQQGAPQAEVEPPAEEPADPTSSQHAPHAKPQRPNHPPRLKMDSELLSKFAWKIYLSEVSEEGVALIGDNDAKDLSRRCFRLAEIFLEEQNRRG